MGEPDLCHTLVVGPLFLWVLLEAAGTPPAREPCPPANETSSSTRRWLRASELTSGWLRFEHGTADGLAVGWRVSTRSTRDHAILERVGPNHSEARILVKGCLGDPLPTCFVIEPPGAK